MNITAKTINIYLIAEMQRETLEASFDYLHPVISEDGKELHIIPQDPMTSFIDAYLSDSFITADNIEDSTRIFGINLTANIELIDTENDNFYIAPVDEIGELVIKLDANLDSQPGMARFIAPITVNADADLVVEDLKPEADSDDDLEITAEVLTEAEIEEPEQTWIITYNLDSLNEDVEIADGNVAIISAPDIQTAAKYAEQNARIKAKEDPNWESAEVISIKKNLTAN